MTRHRFINDGVSPIPMGATAEYRCVCGKRGTRAVIERHVAENSTEARDDAAIVRYASSVNSDDDFDGGDTKAHYLPIEPREPAPSTFAETEPSAPELPPPPPSPILDTCQLCQIGVPVADLPEIVAWSCGHWIRKKPQPIAESFQDMLRLAYRAGVQGALSGETFENWYQREVLQ